MRSVSWYVERLRAMSLPEIIHRIEEWRKRRLSSREGGWGRFTVSDLPLPYLPLSMFDLATPFAPEELDRWREVYRNAQSGAFRYLGQTWPVEARHRRFSYDPASGRDWPTDTYCFRIPYRHSALYGDVKYVWEINRLQYLQPIAMLAHATGDSAAARFCIDEIIAWCDLNPPFKGVAWASGIELALRVLTILMVTSLVEATLTKSDGDRIKACLNAHLYWLARYPSRFSSANNHLVAEAAALAVIGAVWPEHPRSKELLDYGKSTLEAEALLQIHPDGVGSEQSPTYTAFTVEFLVLAARVFHAKAISVADGVTQRLAAAAEHWLWIMDEAGGVPRIGDDDEGRVIHDSMGCENLYVAAITNSVAATLNRSDLAPPSSPPHLRDRLLGRSEKQTTSLTGVRVFERGGYTVFRDQVGGRMVVVTFDHAPLGYLSIAAHGHADALAFWLSVGDRQIIIDAGTFGYHGAGKARDVMRGTSAHNTVTINEANQSRITGPFSWREHAQTTLLCAPQEAAQIWEAVAQHTGYVKNSSTIHERRLAWDRKSATLTLNDRTTPQPAQGVARVLFSPDCIVSQKGAEVAVTWQGGGLRIETESANRIEVLRREFSPEFGVLSQTRGADIAFQGSWSATLRIDPLNA